MKSSGKLSEIIFVVLNFIALAERLRICGDVVEQREGAMKRFSVESCTAIAIAMALFRYLRLVVDNALDPHGPLSQAVPRAVISEASDQLRKDAATKKRGSYLSFTSEEKGQVAKYGSTSGVCAAIN